MKALKRGLKTQTLVLAVIIAGLINLLIVGPASALITNDEGVPLFEVSAPEEVSPETGEYTSPMPLTFTGDCSIKPCLALTFDDGPDPLYTPQILDSLEKAGAKATFFVLGSHIAGNEHILWRMQADDFEIANHSWGHPYFTKLQPEQMLHEIELTRTALEASGVSAAPLFRPPYGAIDPIVKDNVPLPMILWNVDPKDWSEAQPSNLARYVESQARPGAIYVLHDTERLTVLALDEIIARLQKNYQLVTISELVKIPPDARGTTIIY